MKRPKPPENKAFCMAPWTHTYVSPQTERRLCCASREESSFIHQYIDQPGESGTVYKPTTLEEHWNSEHMRSVRKRMLAGERLPECEVCNDQVLNLHTYRQYFTNTLFPHLIEKAYESTDDDGFTKMKPISFDYRISNLCNFKCRMCGEQLSSSWEEEKRKHGEWDPKRDPWMVPDMKRRIDIFQREVIESEFAEALATGEVEEIYWVGGEPLVWEEHWRYMKLLVDRGFARKVFTRYNTNLSRIKWKGVHLFDDLLPHVKGYNVCASIDGAGKIGEFVRTGLRWDEWLENFKAGVGHKRDRGPDGRERGDDSIVMDLTITLPGLFGLKELLDHALELDVKMYVKIVYAFDPSIMMSPFALPRELLDDLLDDLIAYVKPRVTWKQKAVLDTLVEMQGRPTFEQQWPETWKKGFIAGKEYAERLAQRRGDGKDGRLALEDIYAANPDVLKWWTGQA